MAEKTGLGQLSKNGAAAGGIATKILLATGPIGVIIALVLALILGLGVVAGAATGSAVQAVSSGGNGGGSSSCVVSDPEKDKQRITNTRIIDATAQALGLPATATRIATITSWGESQLTNIGYGDAAGPDSKGLFQQRTTQGWGTIEQVMDPIYATTSFLIGQNHDGKGGLVSKPNWESQEPTYLINSIQINSDKEYYRGSYEPAAKYLKLAGINMNRLGKAYPIIPGRVDDLLIASKVKAILGKAADIGNVDANGDCNNDGSTKTNAKGWTLPSAPPVTSRYGYRGDTVNGGFHYGLDFASGCDTPIYAVNDGTITKVYVEPLGAWQIFEDVGSGVIVSYTHMYANGVLVKTGDKVKSGQTIGKQGSSGFSTGCHLHFEVKINGQNTDPEAFLKAKGLKVP